VLLSSIEGAAISSIKIDGVNHEFQSIDGVVEDVTDIVLNLKKVLIVSQKREPITLLIKANKAGAVTAADIQADANIEIVNPDQLICTLDTKRAFEAEIEIKTGRGYYPGRAEQEGGAGDRRHRRSIRSSPRCAWSSTPSRTPASARSPTTTS
jgi:DNA-directed RNA polymerase subunit alpha